MAGGVLCQMGGVQLLGWRWEVGQAIGGVKPSGIVEIILWE